MSEVGGLKSDVRKTEIRDLQHQTNVQNESDVVELLRVSSQLCIFMKASDISGCSDIAGGVEIPERRVLSEATMLESSD